jgi:hypothetical protein
VNPSESDVFLANLELSSLNRMAHGMPGAPIAIEVAKAVTVAAMNPDIEARVICTSVTDEIMAVLILRGNVGSSQGAAWSTETKSLEFQNGSAVVVIAKGKGTK